MYGREPDTGRPATPARESFYLPNLIAGLVASIGIIVGSLGPWVGVLFAHQNGLEGDGVFTLVLGGVAALVLFTMVSLSRELPAPLPWLAPGAALVALIIAMVDIAQILRLRRDSGELGVQVGWGLWLVALSAAVLCLTATLVAARSGTARAWGTTVVATAALLGLAGAVWLWPRIAEDPETPRTALDRWDVDTTTSPTDVFTPAPRPIPADASPETVPSTAQACPSSGTTAEFATSAVGNTVTSCAFAEEVRRAYLGQPQRGGPVPVSAESPVTGLTYVMTCTGTAVVECTGGNNAVVYLY